jgi:hypothetical protein
MTLETVGKLGAEDASRHVRGATRRVRNHEPDWLLARPCLCLRGCRDC